MRQRAVFDFGEIELETNVFELPTIVPEKFDANPLDLKHFDPSLVYEQRPESSPIYSVKNSPRCFSFIYNVSQLADVASAYQYSDKIIEKIKKKGLANITKEDILKWIKGIHHRMANTLASKFVEHEDKFAGNYTSTQITRWQPSLMVGESLSAYVYCLSQGQRDHVRKPAMKTLKQYGLSEDIIDSLLSLLERHYQNVASMSDTDNHLSKLWHLYHTNKLSNEEKKLLSKVVKICMQPKDIPAAMDAFAEELLEKWQTCEPRNKQQVSELCAWAYYHLTEIHPFFNANGRTSTDWGNIIAVSLGFLSFRFRDKGDKDDPNSRYNKVIAALQERPALEELAEYIRYRMDVIEREVELSAKERYPTASIIMAKFRVAKILKTMSMMGMPVEDIEALFCKVTNEASVSNLEKTANEYYKDKLPEHMKEFSGQPAWKAYLVEGKLMAILMLGKTKDDGTKAKVLSTQLNELARGAMFAKRMKLKNGGQFAVQIIQLDPAKFSQLEVPEVQAVSENSPRMKK